MDTFIQQVINGLVLGSMYALIALGYTMVYGVLNLINFAHGDVLMIGAMVGLSILKLLGVYAPGLSGYAALAIAILGAIPVCMLVNVIIERVAYRRLRNAPRLAPLITAIGVSILLQTFAMMIWGRSPLPFPQLLATEPIMIGGALISQTQLLLLVIPRDAGEHRFEDFARHQREVLAGVVEVQVAARLFALETRQLAGEEAVAEVFF